MPWLHHILNHFPIALAQVAAIALVVARLRTGEPLATASRWLVYLSALSALPVAATGLLSAGHVVEMGGDAAKIALHRDWAGLSGDGMISMGLGWRGMFRPSGPLPPSIFRREFEAARGLGIPLSVHAGSAEGATGQIQALARRKLRMLNAAQSLQDLRVPPANRLEALKGDRSGQYSIRINDQWRICFAWHDGQCTEVEIVDYH